MAKIYELCRWLTTHCCANALRVMALPFHPRQIASDGLGRLTPASIKSLQEQFREQGYLWLKELLDRDDVLAFRRRYFEAFQHTGLVQLDTDPAEGFYDGRMKTRT